MPVYARGYKRPDDLDTLKSDDVFRHRALRQALQKVTPPASYDARTKGIVGPIKDQSQCGSCWDFAGIFVVECAHYLAGLLKSDGSDALSEQFILDCVRSGGCSGDDYSTVFAQAKQTGVPRTADYGPYQARSSSCRPVTAYHKIQDWGYCDPQANGVGNTELIQASILAYGVAGTAVAAGNDWDSYSGGIMRGNNRGINHEVGIVGWYPDPQYAGKVVWQVRNHWGTGWGMSGYCDLAEHADGVGTEAAWATAGPPVPPGPTPPGPVPPGPTPAQAIVDLMLSGTVNGPMGQHTINLTGTGTPRATGKKRPHHLYPGFLQDCECQASAINIGLILDVLKLYLDVRNSAGAEVFLADLAAIAADLGIPFSVDRK